MSLSSVHPEYTDLFGSWSLMRDTYKGEKAVKDKGIAYLPATSSMIMNGMQVGGAGAAMYDAYKMRSYFPDIVVEAVHAMLGVMHNHPPEFQLPDKMSGLIERATDNGESLAMLLRRINEQQIIAGRLGLLVDFDSGIKVGELPYIALYRAEAIKNWDTATATLGREHLNLVVLDESGMVRDADFTWTKKDRYRVLVLGDLSENEYVGEATYRFGVYTDEDFSEEKLIAPRLIGRQLNEIPFTFVNSRDIAAKPEEPPLIGLARLAMLIYRSEADYRQSLNLVKIMTAKGLGAPISLQSVHDLMKEQGLTIYDFEEEVEKIEEEAQILPQNMAVGDNEDASGATPQADTPTASSDGSKSF
jgi:hypothetical protein